MFLTTILVFQLDGGALQDRQNLGRFAAVDACAPGRVLLHAGPAEAGDGADIDHGGGRQGLRCSPIAAAVASTRKFRFTEPASRKPSPRPLAETTRAVLRPLIRRHTRTSNHETRKNSVTVGATVLAHTRHEPS